MIQKPSPAGCAECEKLLKSYSNASLERVRAHGNLKLADLRSDSETMEMLVEGLALATQKLEEVEKRIQEHEDAQHRSRTLLDSANG
jgi:hypothetical protein